MTEPIVATSAQQYYELCRRQGYSASKAAEEVAHSYGAMWARQPEFVAILADLEARFQQWEGTINE